MTELKHVGVLGMKWGVRRRGPDSPDHTTSRTLKKKQTRELSNDEIKKIVTRLSLEKQLSDLSPKSTGIGRKIVGGLINKFGPILVQSFIRNRTGVNINDPFNTNTSGPTNPEIIDAKFKD